MRKHSFDLPRYKVSTGLFDSLSDFADYVERIGATDEYCQPKHDKWAGGTLAQSVERMRSGDESLVAASDALMSKFEGVSFETSRRVWTDDVCGPVPNVPAFIAGHPLNMRRRGRAADGAGPITVFVDTFASASFSTKDIEKRGAAVLALVRVLSMFRPVTLYAGTTTHDRKNHWQGFAVHIDTQPLDLARAAFALTSSLFLRRGAFLPVTELGAEPGIPPPKNGPSAAAIMGPILQPETPMIVSAALISAHGSASVNPEAWITEQLRKAAPEAFQDAA